MMLIRWYQVDAFWRITQHFSTPSLPAKIETLGIPSRMGHIHIILHDLVRWCDAVDLLRPPAPLAAAGARAHPADIDGSSAVPCGAVTSCSRRSSPAIRQFR